MNSIELMMEEHKNITRMLKVMRKASDKILIGEEICYEDFDKMIDFVRNYADAHHHGKEEKFLFNEMADNLGELGKKLVTHGMLVEHDFGRAFIIQLQDALRCVKSGDEESKLDVIANAVGYANHLARHIGKEDKLIYTFAERQLAPEVLERVDKNSELFEEDAAKKSVQAHYIGLLEDLERKYLK